VLNEALFCHSSPAATSRYTLSHAGMRAELQRSSGLWVGPPAGSTAAQRSAGGKVQPLRAQLLQYVVREPYTPLGVPLGHVRGVIRTGDALRLSCNMRRAALFLDGAQVRAKLALGSVLEFSVSGDPLQVVGMRTQR
jgi:NAD+ kinase